jgi:hypothetical protein
MITEAGIWTVDKLTDRQIAEKDKQQFVLQKTDQTKEE